MADGALLNGVGGFQLDQLSADDEAAIHRRAVRRLATSARDAADCALLLDMLGLTAAQGKTRA